MSKSYCRRLENASWRIWAVTRAGRAPVEMSLDMMADVRHRRGAGIPLEREPLAAISEPPVEDGALPSWPATALNMALPHIEPPPLLQLAAAPVAAAVEREALPQSMATGLGAKHRLDLPPPEPAQALPLQEEGAPTCVCDSGEKDYISTDMNPTPGLFRKNCAPWPAGSRP